MSDQRQNRPPTHPMVDPRVLADARQVARIQAQTAARLRAEAAARQQAAATMPTTPNPQPPTMATQSQTPLPTGPANPVNNGMIDPQILAEADRLARQQVETVARQRAIAEAAARQKAEAAARQRQQAEAAARQRQQAEALARQRQQAEALARQRQQAEAAARQRQQAEAAARQREQAEAAAREQQEALARQQAEAEALAAQQAEADALARQLEEEAAAQQHVAAEEEEPAEFEGFAPAQAQEEADERAAEARAQIMAAQAQIAAAESQMLAAKRQITTARAQIAAIRGPAAPQAAEGQAQAQNVRSDDLGPIILPQDIFSALEDLINAEAPSRNGVDERSYLLGMQNAIGMTITTVRESILNEIQYRNSVFDCPLEDKEVHLLQALDKTPEERQKAVEEARQQKRLRLGSQLVRYWDLMMARRVAGNYRAHCADIAGQIIENGLTDLLPESRTYPGTRSLFTAADISECQETRAMIQGGFGHPQQDQIQNLYLSSQTCGSIRMDVVTRKVLSQPDGVDVGGVVPAHNEQTTQQMTHQMEGVEHHGPNEANAPAANAQGHRPRRGSGLARGRGRGSRHATAEPPRQEVLGGRVRKAQATKPDGLREERAAHALGRLAEQEAAGAGPAVESPTTQQPELSETGATPSDIYPVTPAVLDHDPSVMVQAAVDTTQAEGPLDGAVNTNAAAQSDKADKHMGQDSMLLTSQAAPHEHEQATPVNTGVGDVAAPSNDGQEVPSHQASDEGSQSVYLAPEEYGDSLFDDFNLGESGSAIGDSVDIAEMTDAEFDRIMARYDQRTNALLGDIPPPPQGDAGPIDLFAGSQLTEEDMQRIIDQMPVNEAFATPGQGHVPPTEDEVQRLNQILGDEAPVPGQPGDVAPADGPAGTGEGLSEEEMNLLMSDIMGGDALFSQDSAPMSTPEPIDLDFIDPRLLEGDAQQDQQADGIDSANTDHEMGGM